MKRTMKEYQIQMRKKEAVLSQVFDIDEEIKITEILRDENLSNGKRASKEVSALETLIKEKEALEIIIKKDRFFNLTKAREIFEEEKIEISNSRKKQFEKNKIKVEEIENKMREVDTMISELLSENEEHFKNSTDYMETRCLVYPLNPSEILGLTPVLPKINYEISSDIGDLNNYNFNRKYS